MKAIIFLADGFEECEGLIVVDILRRAGVETIMASITGHLLVDSSRHIKVQADVLAEEIDLNDADMVILPGGRLGTENLATSELVKNTVVQFARKKYVAAVCAAPTILATLGILNGRKATVHPDFVAAMPGVEVYDESVIIDGNIITGQALGATFEFAFKLVSVLIGEKKAQQIRQEVCCVI